MTVELVLDYYTSFLTMQNVCPSSNLRLGRPGGKPFSLPASLTFEDDPNVYEKDAVLRQLRELHSMPLRSHPVEIQSDHQTTIAGRVASQDWP